VICSGVSLLKSTSSSNFSTKSSFLVAIFFPLLMVFVMAIYTIFFTPSYPTPGPFASGLSRIPDEASGLPLFFSLMFSSVPWSLSAFVLCGDYHDRNGVEKIY
ncbi:MAG TPA: hypothetical protein VLM75_10055, partial [Spirochaetota bacterium]|nr:hypothetical protein [Spirochaetota bacterium]